ncbi:hypothetical protein Dimus_005587 [Dionaea muscipula]
MGKKDQWHSDSGLRQQPMHLESPVHPELSSSCLHFPSPEVYPPVFPVLFFGSLLVNCSLTCHFNQFNFYWTGFSWGCSARRALKPAELLEEATPVETWRRRPRPVGDPPLKGIF